MVEFKKLTENELNLILAEFGFQRELVVKDYYLSILLLLMKYAIQHESDKKLYLNKILK